MNVDVKCNFCNENGFDLIGLKHHLNHYCEGFELTPEPDDKLLSENVFQKASDDWIWLKSGVWRKMSVDEQLWWSERN